MPTPPSSGFPSSLPLWLRIVLGVIAALVLGVIGLWLLTGGWRRISALLPPSVVRAIGATPGEKVVPQTADPEGAPWDKKHPGRSDDDDEAPAPKRAKADPQDEAPAPAEEGDAASEQEEADAALAPIRARAAAADAAIDKVRAAPTDQQAFLDATKAVDALAVAVVHAKTDALRTSALEYRSEITGEKREALDEARRLGRATHSVVGTAADPDSPYLVLREAANPTAAEGGRLQDGDLVKVQIDLGTGWMRVEALTGAATGKSGYARSRYLAPVKRGSAR